MAQPERGFVHRHPKYLDALLAVPPGGESTMCEMLLNAFRAHASRPCLGTRSRGADGSAGPFVWQNYRAIQGVHVREGVHCTH